MQIEDFKYDTAVLKMGVCLEGFLKRHLHKQQSDLASMIEEFCTGRKDGTRVWMHKIRKARNKATHPGNNSDNAPVFDFYRFQKIRQDGIKLDTHLNEKMRCNTGMSEIMISSLPYDMGNAGDLLKHGVLATFVDWFLGCGEQRIRYADPFGGCPWGYFKEETRRRMEKLSSLLPVIDKAQPHWLKNKYYGSSHVVRNIAKARNRGANVLASDKDKLARSDLEASGIRPIEDHDPKNGFGILDKKHDGRFELILLDPFGDFLRDEFGEHQETPTSHFESISKSVERNPGLCVMLFVLDMKDNDIHEQYVQQRSKYSGRSFCLRCPKMENTGVGGESRFNMEVLLISKRFAVRTNSVSELKSRLGKLRRALEDVLPSRDRRIEFWFPD